MMVRGVQLWLVVSLLTIASFPGSYGIEQPIRKFIFNNNGLGTYSFEFETSDGTYRREDGGLVARAGGDSMVVRGEYGYIDPSGRLYTMRYVADDHGFQPQTDDDTRFNDRRIMVSLIDRGIAEIYTYEDVELRRIFPSEFPQDTVRRSGSLDPEHLGRYTELNSYFRNPKSNLNTHFEELLCYEEGKRKICRLDADRYSLEEVNYYKSPKAMNYMDRRRVYCLMLLCFTEDELDRIVASF